MILNPTIFKAYDIRGIVPSTLNEDVARGLGLAFGAAALAKGEKTVAVGRDGRLSGPSLSAALMQGLVAAGVDVIDVGMVTKQGLAQSNDLGFETLLFGLGQEGLGVGWNDHASDDFHIVLFEGGNLS